MYDVTVVVPAYNEEAVIEKSIQSLYKMKCYSRNHKIKVVYFIDEGSDRTHEIAKALEEKIDCLITRKPGNHPMGKPSALQEAMKFVEGDFLVVLDADCIPPIDFVDRMIDIFNHDPKCVIVQAIPYPVTTNKLVEMFASIDECWGFFLRYLFGSAFNATDFLGRAGVIKTEIIRKYNWEDCLAEDLELSARLLMDGYHFKMIPIYVPEKKADSLKAFVKQRVRWGAGSYQVASRHAKSVVKSKRLTFSQKSAYFTYMLHPLTFMIFLVLFLTNPILRPTNFSGIMVPLIYLSNFFWWSFLFSIPLIASWLYVYRLSNWKMALSAFLLPFFVPIYWAINIGIALTFLFGAKWQKTPR